MSNIIKDTDNRWGSITQTTINNYLIFKPTKWFQKTFQKKKYYKKLSSLLTKQLQKKIEVQKNNKKYIPEVFLELNEVKESLRYIAQPILFYQKELNELENIEFYFFNEVLEKLGIEKKELQIDSTLKNPKSLISLYSNIKKVKNIFLEFKKSIPNLEEKEKLKEQFTEEQYTLLIKEDGTHRRFEWFINDFEKKFDFLSKKFILLTEKAGQGKTNLICDFVDKVMLKKNILGLMFTGNEFNSLNKEEIEDIILKDIYGFESIHITFDNFLDDIEYLCKQDNSVFTIVIDGLNENSNIEQFSQELYKFVEKILGKDFIRLIFTCRSEYFDDRFKIFKKPSFKKDMLMMDNYMNHYHNEQLPEYLEDRLLDSYFQFFQVKNTIFDNVRHQLSNDFLLLRIFCEVYGKKSNPNAPTEQVYNIYKDDLFKRYFEYKKEQIKASFTITDFQKLFKIILAYMIDNRQYINIPFEDLNDINIELLNHIIDEDIFFRKDLIKDKVSVLGNKEVLNFTFDEFRDYLLADYLVDIDVEEYIIKSISQDDISEKHKSRNQNHLHLIGLGLITKDDTSIEGIEKYLFFKSRKSQYREKLKFLEGLKYYDDLFLDNIFSVKDEDIVEEDIAKINELFKINFDFSRNIIYFLMYRHHTKRYIRLNIFTLFELILTLNDDEYDELVNQKFKIKYDFRTRERNSDFLDLLQELDNVLEDRDFSKEYQLHNLFEFMFLLLGVTDESEYGNTPYELIDLLEKYIDKYPESSRNILLKYHDIKLEKTKRNIWKLLNYYAKKQIDFDSAFCQDIFNKMLKTKDQLLKDKYQYFLEKYYSANIELFTDEQKEFFQSLEIERKQQQQYFKDVMNGKIDVEELFKGIDI